MTNKKYKYIFFAFYFQLLLIGFFSFAFIREVESFMELHKLHFILIATLSNIIMALFAEPYYRIKKMKFPRIMLLVSLFFSSLFPYVSLYFIPKTKIGLSIFFIFIALSLISIMLYGISFLVSKNARKFNLLKVGGVGIIMYLIVLVFSNYTSFTTTMYFVDPLAFCLGFVFLLHFYEEKKALNQTNDSILD